MRSVSISPRLLRWYKANARQLPWRARPSPYRVWISEIMLQQTRVDAVVPYYERWMRAFPNIQALAAASEREVLTAWEGLGYYARARNLRRAAQIIIGQHEGKIPADVRILRSLPGIGRYTAGAIASIALSMDEPVLDGNVRRVLARLFDVRQPADSRPGLDRLWQLAREQLPAGRAGDYNQALMDLGAIICIPRNPDCPHCPLRGTCLALRRGKVQVRPVLRAKRPTPLYHLAAAVVVRSGRVLLAQRESDGLLGGLWEFPNARIDQRKKAQEPVAAFTVGLRKSYGLRVRPDGLLCELSHAYTHFRVRVWAHSCRLVSPLPDRRLRWIRMGELTRYPMGKVDRQIARSLTASAFPPTAAGTRRST